MAQSSLGQVDEDPLANFSHYGRASAESLQEWAETLKWGDLSDSVVMDIGCGVQSRNFFNAVFPNFNKVIAIDKCPLLIDHLKACTDKKMSYHVADITDMSTLKDWEGEMKKIVSFYCFNCLTDQKAGFKNVHSLLQPGGEAIIITGLKNPHYECAKVMFEKPKWKPFQTLINRFPDVDAHGLGLIFYQTLLEEIGFHIIDLSEKELVLCCANEESFRSQVFIQDRVISQELPVNLREEFKEEYFQTLMRLYRRSDTGHFFVPTSYAVIILRKK